MSDVTVSLLPVRARNRAASPRAPSCGDTWRTADAPA
ncbi:hypothetical protein B1M_00105, partial [Burkholderia sp. TJI49]